ncbi:MAG: hypothetical protein J6S89_01985 [Paludibacteraceae bacterium]|nr:hypothetical protein [Paludibacteraceae bacterium]
MMDNTEPQEMNIFQVMARVGRSIGKFFCFIFSLVGKFAQLAYKYKALFLFFIILIVGLSIYQRRDRAKMYRAKMHILINDGDVFTYKTLLDQLSEYPKREDTEGLARMLNVPDSIAAKIYGFEGFHVIDINNDSIMDFVDYDNDVDLGDTSNVIVPNQMVIRAKLNDLSCCEEIQKALFDYFAQNNYLSSLSISRLNTLQEKEWMFHNALLNLDSLQKVEFFQGPNYSMEFASQKDRTKPFMTTKRQMYYDDMKKLFDINEEIAVDMMTNLDVMTVISDLQPERKLENPTWKIVLYTTILGMILFAIIALILENRKKMIAYLKNSEKK